MLTTNLQEDAHAMCQCLPPNTSSSNFDWFNKLAKKERWSNEWMTNQTWLTTTVNGTVTAINYDDVDLNLCKSLNGVLDGNGCYRVGFIIPSLLNLS
jgi:hypothetical protein